MKKFLLFGIAGLFLGLLIGIGIIYALSFLSLARENSIYKLFGIKKPHIIGFQPYWMLGKTDTNYNSSISTFTYFGLNLDSDGKILKLINSQEEEPGFTTLKTEKLNKKLQEAKKNNIKLSLLLHNSDEASISALLENPTKHAQNTVQEVFPIMKKYGFSDLNLDIESFKEATNSGRQKFIDYVKTVKKGMENNKLGTLTIEASPSVLIKKHLIDLKEIGKIVDFIVLMTYDFHYIGSYIAGPVAPLNGATTVREYDVETSIIEALKVVSAEKIIIGLPLYGYEWETLSSKPGAATIPEGGSTATKKRIEKLLTNCSDCAKGLDKDSEEAYVIFPDKKDSFSHQIFYEDVNSFTKKIDLAKKYKLNGVALWALGYEDKQILEPLKIYKKYFELVKN